MRILPSKLRSATLCFPGDKSISHRALILGALCEGTSVFTNFLNAEDCMRTMYALQKMGIGIEWDEHTLKVHGKGGKNLMAPGVIDCGNSGTSARLLAGFIVGAGLPATLIGDASLSARPMEPLCDILRQMGAHITATDSKLPVYITPARLRGCEIVFKKSSAQLKSAAILAAIQTDASSIIQEPIPTRDHTERMLGAMGFFAQDYKYHKTSLAPLRCVIPSDFSSAAFFIAAAAATPGMQLHIPSVGINPNRIGLLHILKKMGANIQIEQTHTIPEPVGSITVQGCILHGVVVEEAQVQSMIDEYPALAIAAILAQSDSVWKGLGPLKSKESDRQIAIASVIQQLGGVAKIVENTLHIIPGSLRGGIVQCYGDHRITMMATFMAAHCRHPVEILAQDAAMVATSFPQFFTKAADMGLLLEGDVPWKSPLSPSMAPQAREKEPLPTV